ncbi:LADA_0E04918g1_1 [Lachancea dasiensis]|uniref:LADA_0E04918g1_1 n=1 Tax=Lachancea dasiensis TaxID=1072105 RepID=A0A1G4JBY0_9SACH|nr:LADA_0E04918g1_1 [Lachancea dasiensis]
MYECEPRITPWRFDKDLDELCSLFYPGKFELPDSRRDGVIKVNCWSSRGPYMPHTVESTAHLTDATLSDEQGLLSDIPLQLSYTMAIIRFVNGLLDPTQQSQFAIPLHILAERMGLPSWFVELRHCGTHEREMPSLEMLRMAADRALEWLWDNYWNAKVEEVDDEKAHDEPSTPDIAVDSVALDRLMKRIPSVTNVMLDNPGLWKRQRVSSKFSGDSGSQEPSSKKAKREEPPEQKLETFILLAKDAWKSCRNKPDMFLEKLVRKYKPRSNEVLEVLAHRIQPFGFELSRWVLENYDLTLKTGSSPLREIFDGQQLKGFMSQVCEHALDGKKIISSWDDWSELLRENANWISLLIMDACDLETSNMGDKFRKRHSSAIEEFGTLHRRLQSCVVKSELTMYQLASVPDKSAARTDAAVETTRNESPASEILRDLQDLKRSSRRQVYRWETVAQWTPRPFGQL